MSTTRYISVSSQKGGVGKTSINIIAASTFHFVAQRKVAVIDCDYPQHSLEGLRSKELELLHSSPLRAAQFQTLNRPAYPVVGCTVEEALTVAQEMDGQFELVVVDTPGTINVAGLIELWKQLDYIFIPLEADRLSIEATLSFVAVLEQFIKNQPGSRLKQYYTFWNKHIKSEKQAFYERTEEFFAQQNIPLLQSRVEHSVNYKKEALRSTLFPLAKEYERLGITGLMREMEQIVFPGASRPTAANAVFASAEN